MSIFSNSEGSNSSRELRRLAPAAVTPISYASRDVSVESMESFRTRAVREGYEEGYADGRERAALEAKRQRDELESRTNEAISVLERAIREAQDLDRQRRDELQKSAAELAFSLLEELFAREVSLASNPGREAITRALALDSGTEPATVRLNPDDIDVLGEYSDLSEGRSISVIADSSIERGGALVEIGRSTLDAQLSSALERVRRVLVGSSDAGLEAAS